MTKVLSPITIRKANIEDLENLLAFEQGVIEAERPFDSTLKITNTRYYDLESLIQSEDAALLIADTGTELVASGYARIEISKSYLQHTHHAYLGFMYVRPDYRGKGINKMIIEALKQWAHSRNVNECRLEVYVNNFSAVCAYEKIGFVKHMVEMRFNIED